jgi:hypothetical protein
MGVLGRWVGQGLIGLETDPKVAGELDPHFGIANVNLALEEV